MIYRNFIEECRRARHTEATVGRIIVRCETCSTCGAPPMHRCLSLGTSEPQNTIHAARAKAFANRLQQELET